MIQCPAASENATEQQYRHHDLLVDVCLTQWGTTPDWWTAHSGPRASNFHHGWRRFRFEVGRHGEPIAARGTGHPLARSAIRSEEIFFAVRTSETHVHPDAGYTNVQQFNADISG
jgi:hypothetical protein